MLLIPSNNILIQILSEIYTRFVWFLYANKHLPKTITWKITSSYRSPQKNRDVGGVINSAHLYGLALDVVFFENGAPVTFQRQTQILDKYIRPFWRGFALSEYDHAHLNLNRSVQQKIIIPAAIALGAGVIYWFLIRRKK